MSTTSQRHPLPTRTSRRPTGVHVGPRSRRGALRPAEELNAISLMGPANRAPGGPVMGSPGQSLHLVMGGPDSGPRLSVMGAGDGRTRIDLFGDGDPRFVDLLFTLQRR